MSTGRRLHTTVSPTGPCTASYVQPDEYSRISYRNAKSGSVPYGDRRDATSATPLIFMPFSEYPGQHAFESSSCGAAHIFSRAAFDPTPSSGRSVGNVPIHSRKRLRRRFRITESIFPVVLSPRMLLILSHAKDTRRGSPDGNRRTVLRAERIPGVNRAGGRAGGRPALRQVLVSAIGPADRRHKEWFKGVKERSWSLSDLIRTTSKTFWRV